MLNLYPTFLFFLLTLEKNRIKILYNDGEHLFLLAMRFEYALYFSFHEGIVFDSISFDKFINTVNPRRRVNRIKKR